MTMKKMIALLLTLVMCASLFLCACGSSSEDDNALVQRVFDYDDGDLEGMLAYIDTEADTVKEAITNATDTLIEKYGTKHKKYSEEKFAEYYAYIHALVETYFIDMQKVCMDYYACVAAEGLGDYDKWDTAMTNLYDTLSDIDDEVCDQWMKDMMRVYDVSGVFLAEAQNSSDAGIILDHMMEVIENNNNASDEMFQMRKNVWNAFDESYWVIRSGFSDGETDVAAILKAAEEKVPDPEPEAEPALPEVSDEIRPEFASAMEEYKEFYKELCDFVILHNDDADDAEIVAQYEAYIEQSELLDEEFVAWGESVQNDAESEYYWEVYDYVIEMLEDTWS